MSIIKPKEVHDDRSMACLPRIVVNVYVSPYFISTCKGQDFVLLFTNYFVCSLLSKTMLRLSVYVGLRQLESEMTYKMLPEAEDETG